MWNAQFLSQTPKICLPPPRAFPLFSWMDTSSVLGRFALGIGVGAVPLQVVLSGGPSTGWRCGFLSTQAGWPLPVGALACHTWFRGSFTPRLWVLYLGTSSVVLWAVALLFCDGLPGSFITAFN